MVAILALVGGLGYGAWTFLTNIQQVSSASASADAGAVVSLTEISRHSDASVAIDPSVYDDDGVLAQLYRTDVPAPLGFSSADGPIAAIDPTTAGVFARVGAPTASAAVAQSLAPVALANGAPALDPGVLAPQAVSADAMTAQAVSPVFVAAKGVAIQAIQEVWVRVDGPGDGVLFSGLMSPGEQFVVPASERSAVLKVGNAAGVVILIDGVPYGPMGEKGAVRSGIVLDPANVRASYPQASGVGVSQAAAQISDADAAAEAPRG